MKNILTFVVISFLGFISGSAYAQNSVDGHEYVDLDLPSGTLWATCNVGANSPEEYGNYYAWGETKAYGEEDRSNAHNYAYNSRSSYKKTYYDWSTYKWCNDSNSKSFTKYNTDSSRGTVDNKKTLDLADDAAYVNWGENWRMPTHAEMQELYKNCTWTWTSINGNNGYKVSSKKDSSKSIFLPAAGYRYNSSLDRVGGYVYYWSSSLFESYPDLAWNLYFRSGGVSPNGSNSRYSGRSVRPVLSETASISKGQNGQKSEGEVVSNVKSTATISRMSDRHEYVDLDLPSGTLWATCNVGANSPEEYGNYYAWGETKAYGEEDRSNAHNYAYNSRSSYKKTYYDWSTYKWCNDSNSKSFTKYNTDSSRGTVDNKKTLDLADDAAYVNWGENWRMPTKAEQDELCNNCTWTWTTMNGKNGYKVSSKKDSSKYIFLPAAGSRDNSSLYYDGSNGYYWSSSLLESYPYHAYYLDFSSSDVCWSYSNRCYGRSVRPVRRQ